MIANALIRQYAVGQQIDAEVAGQDIVLHYALALLNDAGLLGLDARPGPVRDDRREDHGLQPPRRRLCQGRL